MTINEKEVNFFITGYSLKGSISIPDIRNKSHTVPIVVFSHGFASSRDEFGDFVVLSRELNDIGIATFRFDYSGCGINYYSLGKILCSNNWVEDLKSAISFVSMQPFINSRRIALLGTSMGATNAINTAAEDKRIKCVISMSPIGNGYNWIKNNWINNIGAKEFSKFQKELDNDRERRVIYGYSNLLEITRTLAYPERYRKLLNDLRNEVGNNVFTYYVQYQSIDSIISLDILDKVRKISPRPLLILAGKLDRAVPWEENSKKIFENASEIKKLVLIDYGDHLLISGKSKNHALKEIIEWLKKYL